MWTPPNRILAARVAGQFGLLTRAQALRGGVTAKALECHLSSGRWIRVHSGVYLTTPGRDDWDVRSTAAVLWAGSGAALARASAGYAWGLVRAEPPVLDVVIPASRMMESQASVTVSRSRYARVRIDAHAWPHRVGAAHTVFDLAGGRSLDRAVTLAARAVDLRLCSTQELVEALSDRPRQPGRRLLLEVLGDVAGGSESAAEVR
ncbi:MAG: type IV toxin-antitoxin system AbiEi family antitoxin domain-containing protein [Lapillicoccus sp.]